MFFLVCVSFFSFLCDSLQALLHFVYRDTLTEDVNMVTSSSSLVSISETLTTKLLAAGDRYGLDRLKLMCASHLCKDISVDSVASILTLADCHHAAELKAVCLKFAAENLAGNFSFPFIISILRIAWLSK